MNQRNNIRILVRGAYDLQKLRIQMGNRIVGNVKVKLGQEPGTKEEDMDDDAAKEILADLRASFKKITDGMARFPTIKQFKGDGVIDTYTELVLVSQYIDMELREQEMFKRMKAILAEYPIFNAFIDGVKGIGPAMAGVIISEFDIYKARYVSSLWMYAGLDVAANGAGRSRKTEHLVTRKYTDKDGKEAERQGITFNPFLKTKLLGVLGPSFIKCKNPKYEPMYRNYKNRLENHPAHAEKSKGHRHNMAIRYMVKQFLVDLYTEWRKIEGLEVHPPYAEGKLGIVHSHAA